MRETYDPAAVSEGSVLLAGHVCGGGLTFFRSEAEALRWLLQPLEAGGYARRPGRQVVRFRACSLERLEPVLPPAPYFLEVPP